MRAVLGCRGKYRSEADILNGQTGRLLHLVDRMCRESNDFSLSQNSAGRSRRQILLTEMHSHGRAAENQIAPVIDDQGYALFLGKFDTLLQIAQQFMNRSDFIPYLYEFCSATNQLLQYAEMIRSVGQLLVRDRIYRRKCK